MLIKREFIGSVVTLVFYAGTLSAFLFFATGKATESIKYSNNDHGIIATSSTDNKGYPYDHE
ncbi:hypothetical protein [Nitrosomonas aestuarii]|uniref:hypothetical protein n=1 Tax=Nitrosomonas aestuarii TaxID=52441 RepID=UPI000D2F5983|nr:hypothetical protein [Nitrosomonas aestuarii]PTN13144.1 hypothetical protein C8R11_101128 [Nitrosomonas aestuarii]